MKVIDAENPLDLDKESSQEPEVSSRHPDEARYDFREEFGSMMTGVMYERSLTEVEGVSGQGKAIVATILIAL